MKLFDHVIMWLSHCGFVMPPTESIRPPSPHGHSLLSLLETLRYYTTPSGVRVVTVVKRAQRAHTAPMRKIGRVGIYGAVGPDGAYDTDGPRLMPTRLAHKSKA